MVKNLLKLSILFALIISFIPTVFAISLDCPVSCKVGDCSCEIKEDCDFGVAYVLNKERSPTDSQFYSLFSSIPHTYNFVTRESGFVEVNVLCLSPTGNSVQTIEIVGASIQREPCPNPSCEGPNPVGCLCGKTKTTEVKNYCCAKDNMVFYSSLDCKESLSCGGTYTAPLSENICDKCCKVGTNGACKISCSGSRDFLVNGNILSCSCSNDRCKVSSSIMEVSCFNPVCVEERTIETTVRIEIGTKKQLHCQGQSTGLYIKFITDGDLIKPSFKVYSTLSDGTKKDVTSYFVVSGGIYIAPTTVWAKPGSRKIEISAVVDGKTYYESLSLNVLSKDDPSCSGGEREAYYIVVYVKDENGKPYTTATVTIYDETGYQLTSGLISTNGYVDFLVKPTNVRGKIYAVADNTQYNLYGKSQEVTLNSDKVLIVYLKKSGEETTCTETDGGANDIYKKGTVRLGNEVKTDRCVIGDPAETVPKLREYLCVDETEGPGGWRIASYITSCPTGYECEDGACVQSGGGGSQTRKCSDLGAKCKAWSCRGPACESNETQIDVSDCNWPAVCCVPVGGGGESKCTDSDGGDDKYVKGTLTYWGNSWSDSCINSGTVMEYYCLKDSGSEPNGGGVWTSWGRDCPTGYTCKDGACVQSGGGGGSQTICSSMGGTCKWMCSTEEQSIGKYGCSLIYTCCKSSGGGGGSGDGSTQKCSDLGGTCERSCRPPKQSIGTYGCTRFTTCCK